MDTSSKNNDSAASTEETAVPGSGSGAAATPVAPGKAKPATTFLTRDNNANLVLAIALIANSMKGNRAFPAPDPTLAELAAARDGFTAAITASHDSRIARSVCVQKRAAVVVLLRKLAHYVDVASAGDLPTVLSSGFPAQRSRAPVGPLSAPEDMRLVRGKLSGQAIARCRKIAQAGAYQWRCAPVATPTAWLPVMTTVAAHCPFEGLTPGVSYLAQACAIGTAGASDWSEAAVVTVL